jgi:Zn-dependent protease/CBS domain-containing protein
MGKSIRVGELLGLEIRLDYSWFIVFGLLAWTLGFSVFPHLYDLPQGVSIALGVTAALLLFASVLVHEISHAIVARAHGTEVAGITLFLFGGVARIKGEPETPKAEFQIAVIGPIVSLLIGGVCLCAWFLLWLAGPPAGVPRDSALALLSYLGVINLVLAAFNLIPGFPLDGGRIMRSALWAWTGDLVKATRWASFAGRVFAWMLITWGIFQVVSLGNAGGLWSVFVGWFLNGAARSAYEQLMARRALTSVPVSDVLAEEVPAADAEMRLTEFVQNHLLRDQQPVYRVMRDGEFLGIVTAEDVARVERDYWGVTALWALARMPEGEAAIDDQLDAWTALMQMVESDTSGLLVLRNGKPEGVISRDSILRLLRRKQHVGLR